MALLQKALAGGALAEQLSAKEVDDVLDQVLDAPGAVPDAQTGPFLAALAPCPALASSELTAGKFCQVVVALAGRPAQGSGLAALQAAHLEALLPALLRISASASPWLVVDGLHALSLVLHGHGSKCVAFHRRVADLAVPLARSPPRVAALSTFDMQARAVQCLGSLCVHTGARLAPLYPTIFDALVDAAQAEMARLGLAPQQKTDEILARARVLAAAFRSLQHVLLEAKTAHLRRLPEVLALCQRALGLVLGSLPSSQPSASRSAASESELSDTESASTPGWVTASRVRIFSCGCIQAMAKVSARQMQGHWATLLAPESTDQLSLLDAIRSDTSPKVRTAAAQALMVLVDGSRQFLAVASQSTDAGGVTSFTSLSERLGSIIVRCHECLVAQINRERYGSAMAQLIKCLGALAANAPYERLGATLLTDALHLLRTKAEARDPTVNIAALGALGGILAAYPASDRFYSILVSDATDPLLPQLARRAAGPEPTPIRLEALHAISRAAGVHAEAVHAMWPAVADAVFGSLRAKEQQVRLGGSKVLEELTRAGGGDDAFWEALWARMRPTDLPRLLEDPFQQVRSSICTMLAQLPVSLMAGLDDADGKFVVSRALVMARDSVASARAAACRCLGAPGTIAVLDKDADAPIAHDVVRTLCGAMRDPTMSVRTRTAWALANLCAGDKRPATEAAVRDIAASLLQGTKDNDKVRVHAVRALGHLLAWAPAQSFSLVSVEDALVDCALEGAVKVRWNACQALGTMLGRHHSDRSLDALISVVSDMSNFKVRINAVVALAAPSSDRARFGSLFVQAVQAVVAALATLDRMEDFSDFKYKSSLQRQLMRAVVTMLPLATQEDLERTRAFFVEQASALCDALEGAVAVADAGEEGAAWGAEEEGSPLPGMPDSDEVGAAFEALQGLLVQVADEIPPKVLARVKRRGAPPPPTSPAGSV